MLLAGCQSTPRRSRAEEIRRAQPLLGTFVVISAYGTNVATTQRAIDDAFEAVRRVDALMSLHRADSELSRANAQAARQPVPVSKELFRVMTAAQDIAHETSGAFDVTIRPVAELWGFIWKQHRLPSPFELEPALANVGYRSLLLDPTQRTVQFARPGVSIDLGGIAKGYAVDRAIESLRAHGITNCMVRAGGDLRASGAPPGEKAWEVQLEDPERQGRRIHVKLRDAAISTAGNYENFFEVNGRRYSHILNPLTGMPVEGIAACAVRATTCMESDGWSTALFVLGPEQAMARFGASLAFRFTLSPAASQPGIWPVVESSRW